MGPGLTGGAAGEREQAERYCAAVASVGAGPPSKVIMATGPNGSTFEYYGRQYRETFARSNVELELRETAGAAENLEPALAEKFRSNTVDPVTALERVRSALRAPQRSAGSSFAIPGL